MSIKYTLGVKTRRAYKSGDKSDLASLINEYDELYKRVQNLYDKFKAQWDRECKFNGFEHHDVRYGALLMRIKHCREILSEYISGKTESIPALEEKILPPNKGNSEIGKAIQFNNYAMTALIKYSED